MTGVGPTARPLRRDAEENLARILTAASDVFAEHGYEASMEQIADRAAVGIGTLYRRFPNKAALVNAVVQTATQRTQQIARTVLADTPGEEGVFEFLRRCVAAPSCWRVITSRAPGIGDTPRSGVSQVAPLVEQLLENARRAGTVRQDVVFADLAVVLMSVRAVADFFDPQVRHTSARYLELVMAGLRPDGTSWVTPPMTIAQLGSVLTQSAQPLGDVLGAVASDR